MGNDRLCLCVYSVSGARIPTLEEAVAMIKQLGLFMLLDVKGTPEEVCVLYTINFTIL